MPSKNSIVSMLSVIVMMMIMISSCCCYGYNVNNNNYNNKNNMIMNLKKNVLKKAAIILTSSSLIGNINVADSIALDIPKVPLYSKKSTDLQSYSDVNRGFKMLRPFGFNEFDGAGGGYAVKFASLFDVDENVIIGSAPATAGKTSIVDYGDIDELGKKLATKRNGILKNSSARETDGIVFYQFEFENPLDPSLPRTGPKNDRPTVGIELYELCVNKGRLWSVQATSNEKLFKNHEQTIRHVMGSFLPRL